METIVAQFNDFYISVGFLIDHRNKIFRRLLKTVYLLTDFGVYGKSLTLPYEKYV